MDGKFKEWRFRVAMIDQHGEKNQWWEDTFDFDPRSKIEELEHEIERFESFVSDVKLAYYQPGDTRDRIETAIARLEASDVASAPKAGGDLMNLEEWYHKNMERRTLRYTGGLKSSGHGKAGGDHVCILDEIKDARAAREKEMECFSQYKKMRDGKAGGDSCRHGNQWQLCTMCSPFDREARYLALVHKEGGE